MVPLPGRAMPRASHRQFIELAVNMPEHEPQVGQALCSSFEQTPRQIFPVWSSATPLNTEIKSDFSVAGRRCAGRSPSALCWATPAAMGPPLTNTVGMFTRMAAINMPGHDLVAVRDADHAVEAVGTDHGLDAIGDELARGQRVFHAAVAHGDAVIHADGVEDERHAARLADQPFDEAADLVQVGVAGDAVGVGVDDGHERLVPVRLGLDGTGGAQQGAMRRAFKAFLDDVRAHKSI